MSQDVVSDGINQMMNAVRRKKTSTSIKRYSKVLTAVLAIAKLKGYIDSYNIEGKVLNVQLGKLNGCKAVKPRIVVKIKDIDRYIKRYLPAKNIGTVILSTSQGLMTHQTAIEKNIGGSLIAYFY